MNTSFLYIFFYWQSIYSLDGLLYKPVVYSSRIIIDRILSFQRNSSVKCETRNLVCVIFPHFQRKTRFQFKEIRNILPFQIDIFQFVLIPKHYCLTGPFNFVVFFLPK